MKIALVPGPWTKSSRVMAPTRREAPPVPPVRLAAPQPEVPAPPPEQAPLAVAPELVRAVLPGRWAIVDALARLGPLDESALVLAAWRASPGLFGLPGHEWEYPDAGAVRTRIGGASGCVHRGWVERREDGRYAVTRAGRRGLAEAIERAAEACRGGAIGPARRAVGAPEEGER